LPSFAALALLSPSATNPTLADLMSTVGQSHLQTVANQKPPYVCFQCFCITTPCFYRICAFTCPSMCMSLFILTCRSCLLLSFCAALTLCLLLVSALQSYSQWDSTELPLCEAYRRRDSWASPNSSCSSTQDDREDTDGPPPQETSAQHHLNGHGAAAVEKP